MKLKNKPLDGDRIQNSGYVTLGWTCFPEMSMRELAECRAALYFDFGGGYTGRYKCKISLSSTLKISILLCTLL